MVLRETDRVVREATARPLRDGEDKRRGKRPLSVSTDRIAYTAMRCARILAVVGEADGKPVDLAGGGRVAEVYPDAALREWGIWPDDWDRERLGYKGTSIGATKRRRELMKRLVARAGDWLAADQNVFDGCERDDDKLDALVSALVARAVGGCSQEVSDPERPSEEGWIHLPQPVSLDRLCG